MLIIFGYGIFEIVIFKYDVLFMEENLKIVMEKYKTYNIFPWKNIAIRIFFLVVINFCAFLIIIILRENYA